METSIKMLLKLWGKIQFCTTKLHNTVLEHKTTYHFMKRNKLRIHSCHLQLIHIVHDLHAKQKSQSVVQNHIQWSEHTHTHTHTHSWYRTQIVSLKGFLNRNNHCCSHQLISLRLMLDSKTLTGGALEVEYPENHCCSCTSYTWSCTRSDYI